MPDIRISEKTESKRVGGARAAAGGSSGGLLFACFPGLSKNKMRG
jgi:hypothetical protein